MHLPLVSPNFKNRRHAPPPPSPQNCAPEAASGTRHAINPLPQVAWGTAQPLTLQGEASEADLKGWPEVAGGRING